jgi:hypothetical protein
MYLINSSIAEQQQTSSIVVSLALGQLITVNVKFEVLLYIKPNCHKAVSLASAVQHLCKIHTEKPEV